MKKLSIHEMHGCVGGKGILIPKVPIKRALPVKKVNLILRIG